MCVGIIHAQERAKIHFAKNLKFWQRKKPKTSFISFDVNKHYKKYDSDFSDFFELFLLKENHKETH